MHFECILSNTLTLVSVTMQSNGQENTTIFASLTDVRSPSVSFLKTIPCSIDEACSPQPYMNKINI